MYKPPFLRRILPWLYALVFLVVAPILILYTAGYTYNLKKRVVERNGVLIVDGSPKGAQIWLDGRDTGKTMPYTFQTLSPGTHTVHVQKTGYSNWEKRLDIRAEQVSFANQVQLWGLSPSTLTLAEPITSLRTDPTDSWVATMSANSSTHFIGRFKPTKPDSLVQIPLPQSYLPEPPIIRWNVNGTSFVLNGTSPTDQAFAATFDQEPAVNQLPNGMYSWSSPTALLGSNNEAMTQLEIGTNRFSRQLLTPPTIFQNQEVSLQTTGTPAVLLLTKRSLQDKIYQLAQLDWRPIDQFQNILILKDQFTQHWMALDLGQSPAYAGDVWGDEPRWFQGTTALPPQGLFLNGGEVWIWQPTHDPILVWRQAEPLVQAVWNSNGSQLILADKTHVFSLELDDRDGRQTNTLATFDEIQDLTLFRKRLYIAGRLNGQHGVWERIIE